MQPVRYFVVNAKTNVAHICGYCQQTKPRNIPIRLFDSMEELQYYAQRPLLLCRDCRKKLEREE